MYSSSCPLTGTGVRNNVDYYNIVTVDIILFHKKSKNQKTQSLSSLKDMEEAVPYPIFSRWGYL
jgi:hypothetical protein